MTVSYLSRSPEETKRFGALLAAALEDGAVVALLGELGAGKTALVQGAAEGLGARAHYGDEDDHAVSPTFVLVREYDGQGGRRIVHVDAHRLRTPDELTDLGADDFLGAGAIAFVEWADRVDSALPRPLLSIKMSHAGRLERRIEVAGVGRGSEAMVDAAFRALVQSGCAVEKT
jgi:tRNA threonylcarbamoyladenosine biosynthesis protein TsaE